VPSVPPAAVASDPPVASDVPVVPDAPVSQILAGAPVEALVERTIERSPDPVRPAVIAPSTESRRHPSPVGDGPGGVCTAPQLRRFIKSRAYVPLHELRRRFELNGSDDEVCPVDVDGRRLFVGLPDREAALLGELLRSGDVGYELLLDPSSPLIVGVFPMRPVPRG
jgi:hypothetical protein